MFRQCAGVGSSINAEVYTRGHPSDYDRWVEEVLKGWGVPDISGSTCLLSEGNTMLAGPWHGTEWPAWVYPTCHTHPVHPRFRAECQEMGYPTTPISTARTGGAGIYQ